ncbi:MAG TPA: hypothetical protein DEP05_07005 [Betaproteobacteria bacterium]|nr:hypothetical protein [Betaproteobacteria bacterium]
MTSLQIRVVSKQPPGGRCTLYAAYAEAISQHFDVSVEIEYHENPPREGVAYPALVVNDKALSPADGVILSPEDVCAGLARVNANPTTTQFLIKELERIQSYLIKKG